MDFLRIQNLTKRYGGVNALDDISVAFQPGEIHSVVGENGAGKSTFLKILSGTAKADSGEIYLDKENVVNLEPNDLFRRGITIAFQETSLFANLTVAENIFLGNLYDNKRFRVDWRRAEEEAGAGLNEFGIDDISPKSIIGSLSSEHRQIIEIVKSIKPHSRVICMDEPTASLTQNGITLLFSKLQKLKENGVTVIYVSHNLDDVLALSDRITVFRDGKKVDTIEKKTATNAILHEMMIGKSVGEILKKKKINMKTDPMLKVENISSAGVVMGVTFSAYRGEILGITGLVGAGRSELMWAVFGYIPKQTGTVTINGKIMENPEPYKVIGEGMIYLPEERRRMGLFLDQSLSLNTTISNLKRLQKRIILNFSEEKEETKRMLKAMNVKYSSINQAAISLSGGNQQKVLFGKCLFAEPRLLVLDEPTRGIDVGSKEEIYNNIKRLSDDGLTVIIVSSEVEEICLLSDRVLVMGDGRIIGEFQGGEINEHNVTACYLKTT